MSQLVDKLKSDHKTLVELLNKVQKLGVGSEQTKGLLLQAKSTLINHLKKEDQELYPTLHKAAKTNEDIQRRVNSFGKDMEEITKFVLQFFDKIEKGTYTQMDYARNFGKLMSVLNNRISREENILYPLYESCQ